MITRRRVVIEFGASALADRRADVLYVPNLTFGISNRDQIAERALKAKLPLVSNSHEMTTAGGLLSYAAQSEEDFRCAAAIVDKILRGAKPAELPVEQLARFTLVVNGKTAQAVRTSISPVTMLRADKVIE